MCMSALTTIGSRRGARRLIQIAGGNHPLPARQEAIYTLWHLRELRAEPLFIRLSCALETEEEYTRDMATEALGNTSWRSRTQRALSERLFDPSVSVRFAALCAAGSVGPHTSSCLRNAIIAKLADPAKVDDNRVIATLASQLLGVAPAE
jgi:HEAT repeat protein